MLFEDQYGPKNHARAVTYCQLALAQPDKAKAAVLYQIADEAERDVFCTVDRMQTAARSKSNRSRTRRKSSALGTSAELGHYLQSPAQCAE